MNRKASRQASGLLPTWPVFRDTTGDREEPVDPP